MPASRRATGALALAVAGVFGSFVVVGLSFDPASAAEPAGATSETQVSENLVADEPGATTVPNSASSVTGVSTEPGSTSGGDSDEGSTGGPTGGATATGDPDPGETTTPPVETTTPPTEEPTSPPETPTPTPEPTEPVETGGTTPDPGVEEPAPEQPPVDEPIRQEPGGPTGAPEAGGEVGENIVPVEPGHRGGQDSTSDNGTRPTVKQSPTTGPSSASDVDVSAPTPSATPQADDLANTGVNGNLIAVFSIAAIIVAIGTVLLRRRNGRNA